MKALLAALVLATAAEDEAPLTGRVVDSAGEPVAAGRLELSQAGRHARALTDDEGRFSVPGWDAGSTPWTVRVTSPSGVRSIFRAVADQVRGGACGDVLVGPPSTLLVRVVDRGGDTCCENQTVFLYPVEDRPLVPAYGQLAALDPEAGEYRFEDVPPGAYELTVAHTMSEVRHTQLVEVEAGVETFVETRGGPPARVTVRAVIPGWEDHTLPDFRMLAPDGSLHAPSERERDGPRHFVGLPKGEYWLHHTGEDEFEPWGQRVDHDAGVIEVELLPRARLVLSARFPGGDHVPQGVEVFGDWSEQSPVAVWNPLEGPRELRAVPGGRRLEVRAPGFPPRFLTFDAVAGENPITVAFAQEVDVPLQLEATPDGARVDDLQVALIRGFGPRQAVFQTRTDAAGRATVPVHPLEPSRLFVRWAPWHHETLELEVGTGGPVTMRLPDAGWIEGEIALPPELDPERWKVCTAGTSLGVPLDKVGRYRLGPLEPGVTVLELLGPDEHRVRVGAAVVEAGAVVHEDADLSATFPARVAAVVGVDGERRSGDLLIFEGTGGATQGQLWMAHLERGRAAHDALVPGEYRVRLIAPSWGWEDPDPVVLGRGERRTYARDIEVVRRGLRFVDGEGRTVTGPVGTKLLAGTGILLMVDPDGRTEGAWPAGPVGFSQGGRRATVEWRAGPGELVVELRPR